MNEILLREFVMNIIEYKWKPIEDLATELFDFSDSDLVSLAISWQERSRQLKDSQNRIAFLDKLRRKWAIETGIIERIYTIDRGITEVLIEQGIEASLIPHGASDKPAELVVSIINDQKEVIDGIFDFITQRRKLSISYIREIHQVFTRHQPTTTAQNADGDLIEIKIISGDWKYWPNNPRRQDGNTHEYCPPEQVASEMDRLIAMHLIHCQKNVSPEVEAAWLHHRFTQIHPFQDGNGRVARTLASLVLIRAGWFPLVITNDMRDKYITTLEEADNGDLEPFIKLIIQQQKAAFREALSIADELRPVDSIQTLIEASLDRLREKKRKEQNQVFELVKRLEEFLSQELRAIADQLNSELHSIDQSYWASVKTSEENNSYWFKTQLIRTAKEIGYYANFNQYRAWVQLKINEERMTNIVFSFHSLGFEFSGIMAVSAFLEFRDEIEDSQGTSFEGPYRVCEDIFQFTYSDDIQSIEDKFQNWLNDSIVIALAQWRRQL
jgi:Fic family protein